MVTLTIELSETLKTVGLCLAILSPVVGFCMWAITQLLDARKDRLHIEYDIAQVKDRVTEHGKTIDNMEDQINIHENKIGVLIEKTKKM